MVWAIVSSVVLVILAILAIVASSRGTLASWMGTNEVSSLGPFGRPYALGYSFQTDLSFAEVTSILGARGGGSTQPGRSPLWEWFERDSAWYDNLLSCSSPPPGVRMNLYFFDDENILEFKFTADVDAKDVQRILAFGLNELLPALGARDVKQSHSVD